MVCDGSSDRILTQIIDWTLWQCGVRAELISRWADLRNVEIDAGLPARVRTAIDLFPCDLLFVHRDAEAESREQRLGEIDKAVQMSDIPPHVAVIPIRMQESWLLCDEKALRGAAGNPSGTVLLNMPRRAVIEMLPDPKEKLFELLRVASERTGRRLQQLNVEFARSLICEHMADFSSLRDLPSFASFEKDLSRVVKTHHLDTWR